MKIVLLAAILLNLNTMVGLLQLNIYFLLLLNNRRQLTEQVLLSCILDTSGISALQRLQMSDCKDFTTRRQRFHHLVHCYF